MAVNLLNTAKKLIQALNSRNYKLTYNIKQFIGRDNLTHTSYCINQATWNPDKNRYDHAELYSSTSLVRVVMFLRDMWYIEIGQPLPTDQEEWNKVREELPYGRNRTKQS